MLRSKLPSPGPPPMPRRVPEPPPAVRHRPSLPRRLSPPRPWQPLSDTEWAVLSPFVFRHTAGRPVQDARLRLDAIFWLAAQPNGPRADYPGPHGTRYGMPARAARWADLPPRFGKPDTVSRQFRRWAKSGLWPRLLYALADPAQPGHQVLRTIESWICRAYRRAWRLLGIPGTFLARRLGLLSALRAPPELLPDPDLSEDVRALSLTMDQPMRAGRLRDVPSGFFGRCARLFGIAQGRKRIPWHLAPV